MSELLDYGVEELGGIIRVNSSTKTAFKNITGVFEEIYNEIKEQNQGTAGGFCELLISIPI